MEHTTWATSVLSTVREESLLFVSFCLNIYIFHRSRWGFYKKEKEKDKRKRNVTKTLIHAAKESAALHSFTAFALVQKEACFIIALQLLTS